MSVLRDRSQRLLVVVGASGAGKDSVLSGWLATLPPQRRPHRARRTITRATGDPSEEHEALGADAFAAAAAAGAFALVWQAHGLHYGIRWSELAPLLDGQWVVMNGSRAHLDALRALAPQARVIEVVAPDAVRAARLAGRARASDGAVSDRLARSVTARQTELRIDNGGTLDAAIAQLDAWWQGLAMAAPMR